MSMAGMGGSSTPTGLANKLEPSFVGQLEERRQRLLVELRDVEQAIESIKSVPGFDHILQRILAAHRY